MFEVYCGISGIMMMWYRYILKSQIPRAYKLFTFGGEERLKYLIIRVGTQHHHYNIKTFEFVKGGGVATIMYCKYTIGLLQ